MVKYCEIHYLGHKMKISTWKLDQKQINDLKRILEKVSSSSDFIWLDSDIVSSDDDLLFFVASSAYRDWYDFFNGEFPYVLIGDELINDDEFLCGTLTHNMLSSLTINELRYILRGFLAHYELMRTQQEMLELGKEVKELDLNIINELKLVKKIYKHAVPLRSDNFEECEVSAKFMAGSRGGGEFFDWKRTDHLLQLYLISTSSYALTGELLQLCASNYFATCTTPDALHKWVDELQIVIDRFLQQKKVTVDITFLVFDLKTMLLHGYNQGNARLVSNINRERFVNFFQHQCQKDEILLLQSSGFLSSQRDKLEQTQEIDIASLKELSSREFFDQQFMKLVDVEDDFLAFDSTLIRIEVLRNGLFKI